jgi:hypothetical protein
LEVLLKMNRPDFGELVAALKTGTSKGERFQPAKPENFDGARDQKVVDAWLMEMKDYLHAAKLGRHSTVELAQSYLKGYAATWWRTVKQEEGKSHGYTWEFFKEHLESEFFPRNFDYICRNPSIWLATKARRLRGCGPRSRPGSHITCSRECKESRECEGMNPHTPK